MTIDDAYYNEEISIRSYNVCINNDLKELSEILKYYRENGSFENLRNCGKKSNLELISLCLKYGDYDENHTSTHSTEERQIVKIINNLTRIQEDVVNRFIEIDVKNLSIRGNNSLSYFLNKDLNIRNICNRILINEKFNFKDLKNVGEKTVEELKSFFDSIIDFVEKVTLVENENELIALRNRFFLEKTFSISTISNEIINSQSIFSLIDYLIINDVILEKNQNLIFQKAFKIYLNQPELTLNDIAEELNISKERVRQLRKVVFESLFIKLKFVRNIDFDLFKKYSIDDNQILIFIEDDLRNLINQDNNTSFTNEFLVCILYSYISDKFDLIGEIEDVLFFKNFNSSDRHNWDNLYLVDKRISSLFNFNLFVNDIWERVSERIEDSYSFNFKSYLMNFFSSTDFEALNMISEVAEKILDKEFEIYLDLDENIFFSKNSNTQAYEYAYAALKQLGKPSKVNEISDKVKELFPDINTNDAKIRTSMKRVYGFVPIGRSSIFGLKEWEKELTNFKGGTIRDIVSIYLESQIDPKHISDITKYVLIYRTDTYERSILDNLKADTTKKFIFFKNSTIGLRSKIYEEYYKEVNKNELIETKNWEERYYDFQKFIEINNRLPFSNSTNQEESKLYRWYQNQKRKIKIGKLIEEKCILLNQILSHFDRN